MGTPSRYACGIIERTRTASWSRLGNPFLFTLPSRAKPKSVTTASCDASRAATLGWVGSRRLAPMHLFGADAPRMQVRHTRRKREHVASFRLAFAFGQTIARH